MQKWRCLQTKEQKRPNDFLVNRQIFNTHTLNAVLLYSKYLF